MKTKLEIQEQIDLKEKFIEPTGTIDEDTIHDLKVQIDILKWVLD